MDFVNITPQQKRQFDEEGYLIMREAIDSETVSSLIEAGDRLIASDRELNRQRLQGGFYDGFRNCVSMDDAFRPLITNPKVFSIVAQLLSPWLSLLTSHLIYRAPDPPGSPDTARLPGWHRDHYMSMRDLGDQHIPAPFAESRLLLDRPERTQQRRHHGGGAQQSTQGTHRHTRGSS